MKFRILFTLWLFACTVLSVHAAVKDTFTALEQQQISIETPRLFEKSNTFSVDFSILEDKEYCFPLPVGKVSTDRENNLLIETTKGDAVKAMFNGTVRLSRHIPGYGNVIVIRHDNGFETVYAYNAQNMMKVGDNVKAGQTVAIVGGKDKRVYCLFFIMVDGRKINPETLIEIKSHRLRRQTVFCKKSGSRVNVSVEKADAEKAKTDKQMAKSETDDPFAGSNVYKMNLSDLAPSQWAYPLPGSHVISPYGGKRRHGGVDIKTKPNDKILAAFDGVVTRSSVYFGYGNCIVIKHPNGLETLYSHNSKNLVKVGDKVKAGQVIALTGRTGRATTEHLHLECRINGHTINPAIIFDHANHSLQQSTLTFTKNRNGSITMQAQKNYYAQGKKR